MRAFNLGAVRRALYASAVLTLLSVPSLAQVVERGRTFADLTASHPCDTGLTNRIARVTDCDAADDFGDGGGAFQCWAYCDGSAPWTNLAIGGGAGGGVSGLDTADGGAALSDNAIVRGDGTTGIQGSAVTIADTTGDLQWEGTTADAYEGNFAFTDPTADWTVTFGATGSAVFEVDVSADNFYSASAFYAGSTSSANAEFAVDGSKVYMGGGIVLGWTANANPEGSSYVLDTQFTREAADIVKLDSMLELTPVASGGTCDAGNAGRIYSDTSPARCWCDGTTVQKLSGAGTCD